MFKNYIKIAWRNLWKRKAFTLLNIIGLSIAFTVAILLSMTATFELSHDKFHTDIGRIYQVINKEQTAKGSEISFTHAVPFTPTLREEVPGVQSISRYLEQNGLVSYGEKDFTIDIAYVDNDFFSMFSFPEIKGNITNALKTKSNVVLTEKSAMKLFGTLDVIGKTVTLLVNGKHEPFVIAGILHNIPFQSSLEFDIAVNFENHTSYTSRMNDWSNKNHEVYLKLQENIAPIQFEKNTREFSNLHFADQIENAKRDGAQKSKNNQYQEIKLSNFADKNFVQIVNGDLIVKKTYPYLILSISILILFIASVNFINMSIGASVYRLREIGVRKTMGARKTELFFQFWSESIFIFLSSIGIGLLLASSLLKPFKTLFRTEASFANITTQSFLISALFGFLIITCLAGGYPAYILSKLGTLQSLKGKLNMVSKNRLRDSLMVFQFSIAILLMSGSLVLWKQIDYMRTKDLGFNKEQVISFPLNGKKDNRLALELLRNELSNAPQAVSISASDNNFGLGKDGSGYTSVLGFDYKERGVKTNMLIVDYDYLQTLDLSLVSGRTFNRKYANDSLSVIINEAMAKEIAEKDPVQKTFSMGDSTKYTIIGVVKDYHFEKLNKKIEPITFFMDSEWDVYYAYVKIKSNDHLGSLSVVENAWKKIEPNAEFLGSFLDENLDRAIRKERIMTTIITTGSVIAIALSCIGIFAISLLLITQRKKEIGVRKVVGASILSLTMMLSKDFIKLVGIAFILSSPISYWLLNNWLQGYSYRINLSLWFFILSGAVAILIAFLTISVQTIKAAIANPVKSLRTE
ncbi:ABC transporter permease [Aquimarina addita]